MISGTNIAYKVAEHDYCLMESIGSMLPICDEIIVADCGGGDGTSEIIQEMAKHEPKIKPFFAMWMPSDKGKWIADLTNECRERCMYPWHLCLQADEVISAANTFRSYIRFGKGGGLRSVRYNFWKDAQSLAPSGTVCSTSVVRFAPTSYPSVGDGESLHGYVNEERPGPEIFHYGFLRRVHAFKKKAAIMEKWINGEVNPLWKKIETDGSKALHDWVTETVPFTGSHPEVIRQWLKDRGYEVTV